MDSEAGTLGEKRFKEVRAHNYFTEARALSLRIVS